MPEAWEPIQEGRPLLLDELKAAAIELIQKCSAFKIWLFSGEIGSGKTTLIKMICEQMGVTGGMSSPTYSIVNEYDLTGGEKIYHFDFYRLKGEREAFDLGADEYFDSGNFCFVEWPEKAPSVIPVEHIQVNIISSDPKHRIIKYARHD